MTASPCRESADFTVWNDRPTSPAIAFTLIYIAELIARGLKKPSDAVLDAVVDRITGDPLPAVRLAAHSLVQVGKGLHGLFRLFRSGS